MMKKTNESINIPEDDDYTLQPILKSPEFPRQGEYTVEDYRALPDDGRRFELIDGYLIEMEAPYWVHQEVQMQLVMQLLECLKQSDHDCEIFVAPLDVRIDEDDRTVVEPDIIVLCNYDKPRDHDVMGAPDFVIEILSESNRAHDLIRKYRKYKNAGVREYWIVDPRDKVVRVHYFEKDEPEEVYPFDAIVEIRISEKKCKIDFAVINRKLEQYQSGRRKYGKYPQLTPDRSIILRESLAAYGTSLDVDDDYTLKPVPRTAEFPRQGMYTIEDYMNLPDDGRRFELIDGYLIEMNSPTELHQTILAELSYQIYTCIKQKNLKHCKLLFAPFDVRLDMDNRTMVQPDLLVVCGEKAVNMHAGEGAPDFVIEILSDSNRAHDLVRKYHKYKNAGVREYWIVDPKFRLVRVFCFEKGGSEQVYPFDGEIPVGLSEGSCSVDFSEIMEATQNYYA